jgi:hypothetical protein
MIEQEELYRIERKLSQRIQEIDVKFSNLNEKDELIKRQDFNNLE